MLCEGSPTAYSLAGVLEMPARVPLRSAATGSSCQIKFEKQNRSPMLKHFFNGTFSRKQSQALPGECCTDVVRVVLGNKKVFEMLYSLLKRGTCSENRIHGEIRPQLLLGRIRLDKKGGRRENRTTQARVWMPPARSLWEDLGSSGACRHSQPWFQTSLGMESWYRKTCPV